MTRVRTERELRDERVTDETRARWFRIAFSPRSFTMSGEGGFDDANYDRGMEELLKDEKDENGEFVITEWTEVHETFDTMNLKENLLRGIYAYGFEKPSAIQQQVCPWATLLTTCVLLLLAKPMSTQICTQAWPRPLAMKVSTKSLTGLRRLRKLSVLTRIVSRKLWTPWAKPNGNAIIKGGFNEPLFCWQNKDSYR